MMSCGPSPAQIPEWTANPGRKPGEGAGDWMWRRRRRRRTTTTTRLTWCCEGRMTGRDRDTVIIIISWTPWWHVHVKKNLSTSLFLPLSFFLSLSPACEHKLWVPFIFSWCMWNLTRSMSQLIIMLGHCCSISKSRTDEACFFPVQYAQNRHRNYFLISSYNEWNITVFQPSIRWCQVRSLTQQHPSMSHDSLTSLFYQKYDN